MVAEISDDEAWADSLESTIGGCEVCEGRREVPSELRDAVSLVATTVWEDFAVLVELEFSIARELQVLET